MKLKTGLKWVFTPLPAINNLLIEPLKGLKDDPGAIKGEVQGLLQEARREGLKEEWDQAVVRMGATEVSIRRQVAYRQIIALFCLLLGASSLYHLVTNSALVLGVLGFTLSALWYLTQVLRLFQIRNRMLCSLSTYLAAAKRAPINILPLGIPADWTLTSHPANDDEAQK